MKPAPLILAGIAFLTFGGCVSARSQEVGPPFFTPSVHHQWTWASGANVINQAGIYGTQGTASASNAPGARVNAASWVDSSGNLWLFGGYGVDSTSAAHEGDLNDLWKYSNGEWTWVNGPDLVDQPGSYGVKGVAAPTNLPGPRYQAVSWTDASGVFWLFGGLGLDSTSTRGYLNDLWKYSQGQWTWESGDDVCCQSGTYEKRRIPNADDIPGARVNASSWTDSAGSLWLFGGFGYDSKGGLGVLNDLWRYNAGTWTWMSGSRKANQFGVYGTKGTASASNVPGARSSAVTWIDQAGNLWLFGGQGNDLNGTLCRLTSGPCELNDLWEYKSGNWIWMSGSNVIEQPGIYGTKGVPASTNVPGGRDSALGWIDASGNLWLFGGFGFDSTPGPNLVFGDMDDLWKYAGGKWTWVSGSDLAGQIGSYGTKGKADPSNVPGARDSSVSWIDSSGNLWLFGGSDIWIPGGGKLNDLWEFQL